MKTLGVHFQLVSNECTHFQNNLCTYFLEHAWTKSCQQTRDRQTDSQTTDSVKPILSPSPNFVCGVCVCVCNNVQWFWIPGKVWTISPKIVARLLGLNIFLYKQCINFKQAPSIRIEVKVNSKEGHNIFENRVSKIKFMISENLTTV